MNENPVKIHNKFSAEEIELLKKKAKKISFTRPFFGETANNFVDETTIEESFKVGVSTKFNLNENVVLDETLLNKLSSVIQLNDSSGIGDSSEQPILNTTVQLLNTITTQELFNQFQGLKINLNDSINFSEAFNLKEITVLLDAISVNDNLVNTASFKNQLLSSVGFSELFTTILNADTQDQESDSILIGDDFLQKVDTLFNLTDSTSVSDSTSVKLEIPIFLDDAITVEDDLTINNAIKLNLTDSVTLEDLISSLVNFKSLFTEAILITDDFISTTNFVNNFSSSTNVTDNSNTSSVINEVIPIDVVVNTSEQKFDESTRYYVYGIFVDDVLTSFLILGVRDTLLIFPTGTTTGNITFEWDPAINATGYDFQVATTSNFSTGFIYNLTNLSSITYTVATTIANGTYYWRVRGRNNTTGKIGNWTPAATFNVISLAAPVFTYPLNNQNTSTGITVTWNAVTFANQYDIQLASNSTFATLLFNTTVSTTSVALPTLAKNNTYYLRIRSKNGSLISDWNSIVFTTTVVAFNDSVVSIDAFSPSVQIKNIFSDSVFFNESVNSTTVIGAENILIALSDSISSTDSFTSLLAMKNNLTDTTSFNEDFNVNVITPEQILSNDFYPYQLLTDDPTTKVLINWIDDNSVYLGTNQTLRYGLENQPLSNSLVVSPQNIPNSTKKVYSAEITNLQPNTIYSFKIDNEPVESYEFKFKTQKTTLGTDEYKVAVLSDIHIDYTDGASMYTALRMEQVKAQNPDILCLIGDIVSNSYNTDTTKSNEYIRFFKEHVNTHLNTNRFLLPMVNVPGNHDVGELPNPKPKNAGYFQLFWNTFKQYNSGNNLGSIKIGNYLKLVGLDLFSDTITNNTALINNLIDDTEYVIPFSHFPILPSTTRQSQDQNLFENVVQNIAPALNNKPKIKAYFSGHMHTRYRSKKWKIIQTGTEPTNRTSLGNNTYIVESFTDDFKQEFGQGYRNNRALNNVTINGNVFGNTAWYVQNVLSHSEATFYIVKLKASNTLFTVDEYNSTISTATPSNSYNMLINTNEETEPISNTTYLAINWGEYINGEFDNSGDWE